MFYKLRYPIISLQKKGVNLNSSKHCQDNFDKLKNLFIIGPILMIDDPYKDFVVFIDVCKEGLGVLLQYDFIVCYEFKKLKERNKNHATHYLELVSNIHGLKMW